MLVYDKLWQVHRGALFGPYIISGSKRERRGHGHAADLDHEDWPA